jgi:hypothetical protein
LGKGDAVSVVRVADADEDRLAAERSRVKIDTLPSSLVLPTLIRESGKSGNSWASAALLESRSKGSLVTFVAVLTPPFATRTRFDDLRRIGRWAAVRSRFAR